MVGTRGTSRWYAARFRPNCDQMAMRNLEHQGYEAFCPKIARHVRQGRRPVRRLVPVFPGYLFVRLDPERQRWRPIDSTPGMSGLVKMGERPAPLPPGLVEAFSRTAGPDGEIGVMGDTLAVGDEARIIGGAFENWIGQVIALPPPERVTLLISMATRELKVTIAKQHVLRLTPGDGAIP